MSSTKPGKLPYETPVLVEYGAVQDLTAGGSGAQSEFGFDMMGDPFCKPMNQMRQVALC